MDQTDQDRILVVDDNEAFLNLMVSHLQRRGYSVEKAADGLQALQVLRSGGPFSVLVTDLMMPGMNGIELLREAKKMDLWLEVIVITAGATVETAISAMRADGAYDYLLKPLEVIGELSLAVERASSHRQLRLERERLQARLLAEAGRLQALLANTGDAIISADGDGRLTVLNPAAARLLGRGNLISGETMSSLPEPLATLVANWVAVGERRATVVEVTWPDGTIQMVNLAPILLSSGETDGWVMVLRDVSHLKQLDELKVNMLNIVASRVRLPLAQATVALTELSDAIGGHNTRASDAMYRLLKLWDRIRDWMDELLELIQIESGIGIRLAVVDAAAALDGAIRQLPEDLLRARGLSLKTKVASSLPPVRADADLLSRLAQGLISRAAVRSFAGGEVRLSIHEQRGQVWIDVSDDGPAVKDADIPHLFDIAFAGVIGASENTGLELAMTKTIIERLGGQVWVRGQGQVGSTISVCLPIATRAEAEAAMPAGRASG